MTVTSRQSIRKDVITFTTSDTFSKQNNTHHDISRELMQKQKPSFSYLYLYLCFLTIFCVELIKCFLNDVDCISANNLNLCKQKKVKRIES